MSGSEDPGKVTVRHDGAVAHVTFDRQHAYNALTWSMYEDLDRICAELSADDKVRAVVFRGAGGKAFISGSDISQFREFDGAQDGIDYENKMNRYAQRLLDIPVPTLGVVEGWAVGGGLNILATCDVRIATRDSRFGVPIARTIGNCLSMQTYSRILSGFGEARAKRMLLLAEFIGAEEALAAGFLSKVVERADLEAAVGDVLDRLEENAPITLKVSKAAIGRIGARDIDAADDLIGLAYGSEDFKRGVRAFVSRTKPNWSGK